MVLRTALAAALIFAAARGEDCKPQQLYTSVQLIPTGNGRAEFVPIEVAGVRKLFLLDTGAFFTMLSDATVDELKLQRRAAPVIAYDLTGRNSDEFVVAPIRIGTMQGPGLKFVVAPGTLGANFDGILGADVLSQFDIAIDFSTHRLDIIDPKHCEGKTVYWPERPITVVPIRLSSSGHIYADVKLDGKELRALIDTGASYTALSAPIARRRFDVSIGDANTPVTGKLNDDTRLDIGRHKFATLDIAELSLANPEVTIIPDAMNVHLQSYDRMDSDMIVGMDVLSKMHIYIAYKERKLYLTPLPGKGPATTPGATRRN